jgi:hypothetical protein
MARDGIGLKLEGAEEIKKLLKATPPAIVQKGLRSAAPAAMRPVVTAAKRTLRNAQPEMLWSTGLLEKSLGAKTRVYRRGKKAGLVWVGVGPRSGFKQRVSRPVIYGKGDGVRTSAGAVDPRFADPVRYAHLVEFGARVKGRQTRPVPFMRKAYASKGRDVPANMARKLRVAIPRIITREAKRAKVRRR